MDVVYDPSAAPYAEPACAASLGKGATSWSASPLATSRSIPMNLLLLKGAALVGVFFGASRSASRGAARRTCVELWQLFEAGKLKPVVGEVHPLADYAQAFAVAGTAPGGGQRSCVLTRL